MNKKYYFLLFILFISFNLRAADYTTYEIKLPNNESLSIDSLVINDKGMIAISLSNDNSTIYVSDISDNKTNPTWKKVDVKNLNEFSKMKRPLFFPNSMNNKGQIVGTINDIGGIWWLTKGFIWDSESGLQLTEWAKYTSLTHINDSGDVVGSYINDKESQNRFFWSKNTGFVDIDNLINSQYSNKKLSYLPTKIFREPGGFNNQNQLLSYYSSSKHRKAFSLDLPNKKSLTLLIVDKALYDDLTDNFLNIVKLNDQGIAAGTVEGIGQSSAFIWSLDKGTIKIGDDQRQAIAYSSKSADINNKNEVVGIATDADSTTYPFIWDSESGIQNLSSYIPNVGAYSFEMDMKIDNSGKIFVTQSGSEGARLYLLIPKKKLGDTSKGNN